VKILPLPNKEEPCIQLKKQQGKDEALSTLVTEIFAFSKVTLNPHAIQMPECYGNSGDEAEHDNEEIDTSDDGEQSQMSYHQRIQEEVVYYSYNLECVMVDSDPTFIA